MGKNKHRECWKSNCKAREKREREKERREEVGIRKFVESYKIISRVKLSRLFSLKKRSGVPVKGNSWFIPVVHTLQKERERKRERMGERGREWEREEERKRQREGKGKRITFR